VGLHGHGRRRPAADDPEHRHGRAERGDRAGGARGARRPAGGPGGHADDGTSRALGAAPHQSLDGPLTDELVAAADRDGIVASHDLLYAPDGVALSEAWSAAGALAADLETGALVAVAARHGIAFGAIVAIAVDARGTRCDDEALAAAGEMAGRAAAQALT
jgi:uridine phosphorylase